MSIFLYFHCIAWLSFAGTIVKVTPKKGKATNLKATITVKNEAIRVSGDSVVAVGATTTLKTATAPKNATVTFKSSDDTIATVDEKGVVTGVKAGKVTITATAGKASKDVEIEVKNVIFKDLAQNTVSTFTATVEGNTKDLKLADFTFVNVATKANVAIKSVAVDKKDATKVVITTFAELKDGKEYAITLDGTTKNVTVTDGKVASVSVTPTEIPYGVETVIGLVAKDAKGVVLAQSDDNGNVPSGYELTLTTKTGYALGQKLYLTNKGDTATAKAVKHSYKYENGKEIETVESGDVTITAVDYSAFSGFSVRLQTTGSTKFDEAKDGNTMPVGTDKNAFIKITDANGKEVTSDVYKKYSLTSSDTSVLMISGVFAGQSSPIRLDALKTGTAYILVKDVTGNVVASLPIIIQDKAHPATLTADKSVAVISKDYASDNAVVTFSAKDQYDQKYKIDSNVDVKCTATSAKGKTSKDVNDHANSYFTIANGVVTFNNSTEGTYAYEIKYKKTVDSKEFTTNPVYVTVEVKKAAANASVDYSLEAAQTTIDTTVDAEHKNNVSVSVKMYLVKGGVKQSVVEGSLIDWKVVKDGKTVATTNGAIGFKDDETNDQLLINALDVASGKATKLGTGKYTITATITDDAGKRYVRTTDINVTDNQAKLLAHVDKTNIDATSIRVTDLKSLIANTKVMTFSYGGNTYTVNANDVKAVVGKIQIDGGTPADLTKDATVATSGKTTTVSIQKITVTVTDPASGLDFDTDVAINESFTISQ